ncbi:MAG: TatD family hydrolase [Muribaculaceae bacterium]|nr:TatD family hydrolase [Muribaculaceae bacterium]
MTILDIHTHHAAPQPNGVIAVSPADFNPAPDQLYSVGIHPWQTVEDTPEEVWKKLEQAARHPQVVAIGECGIDLLKGGPLFRQMIVLKREALLAESLGKPLILHSVKGQEMIIGMKKEMNPSVNWMIHGFRGKPTVAQMYLKAGLWLSLGENFNPDSLSVIPSDCLLAETDESPCSIQEVIEKISSAIGHDITQTVADNAFRFLNF